MNFVNNRNIHEMSYLLGLLLIPILQNTVSSVKIVNESLLYPDSAILYANVYNWIKIEGLDSTREYFISSTFGDIVQSPFKEFNNFYLKDSSDHHYDTIVVFNDKMLPVFSKSFTIQTFSKPVIKLDSLETGTVSKAILKKAELLNVSIPGCNFKDPCSIQSYQIYIQCKKCKEVPYLYNQGATLQDKFYSYIPLLKAGDKIIFQSIKIRDAKSSILRIPALTYVIK